MTTLRTGTVEANGLRFHTLEAGAGPLALCLHGFPDSAHTWRHLLPALAGAGFRAVAPFMRGYAPTAVPADGRCDIATLAADVPALHEALGGDARAVLVAHDWGAVAAWGGVAREPDRWRRCVILSVPPLAVFGQIAFRYPQIKRSFYFWFLQMRIADGIVPAHDFAFLDGLWADWSPGYDAREDLRHAKDCLRDPAHLAAALGYYRAMFDPQAFGTPEASAAQAAAWGRPVPRPVLYLHGANDGCIGLDAAGVAAVTAQCGPGSRAELLDGVGHFLHLERPAEVERRILDFVGAA